LNSHGETRESPIRTQKVFNQFSSKSVTLANRVGKPHQMANKLLKFSLVFCPASKSYKNNHVVRKLKLTKVMVGNKRTTKAKRDYASILIHEPEFEAKHQAWRNKKFMIAAEQRTKIKAERQKRELMEKPFREAFALLRQAKRAEKVAEADKKRMDALLQKLQAETQSFSGPLPTTFQSTMLSAQQQTTASSKAAAEAAASAAAAEASFTKIKEELARDKKKVAVYLLALYNL
jgi:hypothetical protein